MIVREAISGSISQVSNLSGSISARASLSGSLSQTGGGGSGGTPYEGEYVFTPTMSTQEVATSGKLLLRNITINPIPSNYGLITWNGSSLTVS